MRTKLAIQGLLKMFSGILLLGILLFLPAGTVHYAGAWRMMGILFCPMLLLGMGLWIANPELLARRLKQKENEKEQKGVILLSTFIFVASFLLCGFDYRFGWSHMPKVLPILGCIVFLLTYLGFAELLRENEYLARTVQVEKGQKVVSTGLYGIVRHPMYAIIFWMFLSMPVIIGSYLGLLPMILLPYIFKERIDNEEKVLCRELEGYEAYKEKVKKRMIPFIW